jgi:hypothetical protein
VQLPNSLVAAFDLMRASQQGESRSVSGLNSLQGAWVSAETQSHVYAKMVNGELLAPYCYGGDDGLTGVYSGWRRAGEYWFARYAWLDGTFSGFAFMKEESVGLLTGAWWDDRDQPLTLDSPPEKHGVGATWKRMPSMEFPSWANRFIEEVERDGLPGRMLKRLKRTGYLRR